MRAPAIPRVLSFLLPIPRCGTRFPDAQEQPGGPNSGAGIPGSRVARADPRRRLQLPRKRALETAACFLTQLLTHQVTG
jgi:hypothetical protein